MKELTASEITEKAIKELEKRGFHVWRANNIAVRGRSFIGKRGCADITGYHKITGIRCECEVKKIGDILSEDQKTFLRSIKEANAHALVAYDNGNGGIYISSLEEYFVKRIK